MENSLQNDQMMQGGAMNPEMQQMMAERMRQQQNASAAQMDALAQLSPEEREEAVRKLTQDYEGERDSGFTQSFRGPL